MPKDKVVVTPTSFAEYDPTPLSLLKERGFKVIVNTFGRKLDKKEILKLSSGCIGIVAGTEVYDRDILEELRGVKVISRCGVGIENVDIDATNRLRIKVYNTPDVATSAVAELTIGLILALLRKITIMDREMHDGLWKKRMGALLSGKQVGIIGFGRIGRKAAEMLKAMEAKVFYNDPLVTEEKAGIFPRVKFKELLRTSDIIILHLSYSRENYRLLGQEEFSLMKKEAFLINCSRGSIVDENALYLALKEGKLAGAAIDVFEQEPYNGPLKELNNIVLTPHIGSYAREARKEMEMKAVRNLLKGLNI